MDEIIQAVKRCHGLCSQTKKVYKDNYSVEKNYELISSISAVIMGVGVYFISYLSLPVIIQFAVQIIFGAIIYVGISYVFKVESFEYILSIVKKKIK